MIGDKQYRFIFHNSFHHLFEGIEGPPVIQITLKGTVGEILSKLSCQDGNARFTTVPFKPLADK